MFQCWVGKKLNRRVWSEIHWFMVKRHVVKLLIDSLGKPIYSHTGVEIAHAPILPQSDVPRVLRHQFAQDKKGYFLALSQTKCHERYISLSGEARLLQFCERIILWGGQPPLHWTLFASRERT